MTLRAEVGTLSSPTSATTQEITVSFGGDTPVAIIMWTTQQTSAGQTTDALFAIGAASSTTARAAIAINAEDGGGSFDEDMYTDNTVVIITTSKAGAVVEQADLSSFSANTVTLSWSGSGVGTAYEYNYLVLGGSGVGASVLFEQSPGTDGIVTYAHGLGATPTALISFNSGHLVSAGQPGLQGLSETSLSVGASDMTTDMTSGSFLAPSSTIGYRNQRAKFIEHVQGTISESATVDSVDATNISLSWDSSAGDQFAEYFFILALTGVQAEVGTYTSPATATTEVVSTAITPQVFLTWGAMALTSTSVESDARFTFGATDGTNNAAAGITLEDSVGGAERFHSATKCLEVYDHADTLLEDASGTISGSDVTLTFSTAAAAANEFIYLALGSMTSSPDGPMPPTIYFASPEAAASVEVVAWKDIR